MATSQKSQGSCKSGEADFKEPWWAEWKGKSQEYYVALVCVSKKDPSLELGDFKEHQTRSGKLCLDCCWRILYINI